METRPTCAVGERWDVQEHRRVTLERRGKNMIGTGVGGMVVILLIYCCVPANKATSDYTKPITIHAAGIHDGGYQSAAAPATAAAPARPLPVTQPHPQQPGGAAAAHGHAPHAVAPQSQPQVAQQPYPQPQVAQQPGESSAADQSQQCGQIFMPDGSRVVYCGSHPVVHFGPDGRPIDYGFHPEREGYPDPWR